MEKWLFDITLNGDVTTLYTEAVDLHALGSLHVSRASSVEWDEARQGWMVTLCDGTSLPCAFLSRENALAAEVAYIQEHWDAFVEAGPCAA